MHTDWDDAKAAVNLQKHGVSFFEAVTIFHDPTGVTGYDPAHSVSEDRFLTAGISNRGRLPIVWHTDRGEAIRIIGARRANSNERRNHRNA